MKVKDIINLIDEDVVKIKKRTCDVWFVARIGKIRLIGNSELMNLKINKMYIDEESALILEIDEEAEQETEIKEDESIVVSDRVKLIDF